MDKVFQNAASHNPTCQLEKCKTCEQILIILCSKPYNFFFGTLNIGRHENCLEHGQHAGGTLLELLRNQIVAVNGKIW